MLVAAHNSSPVEVNSIMVGLDPDTPKEGENGNGSLGFQQHYLPSIGDGI